VTTAMATLEVTRTSMIDERLTKRTITFHADAIGIDDAMLFAIEQAINASTESLRAHMGEESLSPSLGTVEEIVAATSARMDRIRETAAELRAGAIHPSHAANRLDKIANEISRRK
jgi:hypothetical protein